MKTPPTLLGNTPSFPHPSSIRFDLGRNADLEWAGEGEPIRPSPTIRIAFEAQIRFEPGIERGGVPFRRGPAPCRRDRHFLSNWFGSANSGTAQRVDNSMTSKQTRGKSLHTIRRQSFRGKTVIKRHPPGAGGSENLFPLFSPPLLFFLHHRPRALLRRPLGCLLRYRS